MKIDSRFSQVISEFEALLAKMMWLEKKPRDFGTGDLLSPSEIHQVDMIGRQPGINVTQLALQLDVTKGAVSQMLLKLEKKELIQRSRAANNNKEVTLHLTEKGQKAFAGHAKVHADFYRRMTEELKQMPQEHTEFMHTTLQRLNRHLNKDVL